MNQSTFDEPVLRSLLGPPIAFNRALVPVAGSIKAALLLAQMLYWQNVLMGMPGRRDGWFYHTTDEWLRETGMTRSEFEGARKYLVKRRLAIHDVRGFPPKSYYRVEFDELVAKLRKTCNSIREKRATQSVQNLQSELQETNELLTTESTSKTTTNIINVDALFARWWSVYPKKVAKPVAHRTWKKLNPDDALTCTLIAAVERAQATSGWQKDNGQYIPNPATWLSQRRWEDEFAANPGRPSQLTQGDLHAGIGPGGRF